MPHILSPIITESMPGLWFEGSAYKKENLYNMDNPTHPPVNYDSHTFNPHSLPHMETPAHTLKNGQTVDSFFKENIDVFYGPTLVVKLKGNNWKPVDESKGLYHWEVSIDELKMGIYNAQGNHIIPQKLILSAETAPLLENGTHDPNYVLTLDQESADYLISGENFNMYGTSWKSTDFKPGSKERPIHNTIFKKAAIFECLKLDTVSEGEYYFMGFPLPVFGASESPVCPVLFSKGELNF